MYPLVVTHRAWVAAWSMSTTTTTTTRAAVDDIEEFFPGELAPGPPAAMTPDVAGDSDAEPETLEGPVDDRLVLPEPPAPDRAEAALREEARTPRHMMTHTPKNPSGETCKCAKMYKPTKRSKGDP